LVREAFVPEPDDALDRIRAFTQKIPFPSSDEKFVAYLLLLNMAMQDLVISDSEQAELDHWATDLGIWGGRFGGPSQGLPRFVYSCSTPRWSYYYQ
jgi:hypothetical protein